MSFDLTSLLQDKAGSVLSGYLTSQLGESPSVASKAVSLVLPALLGKLVGQSSDGNKMTQLFNLVTGPQIDANITSVEPSLLDKGRQLLSVLFGDTNPLVNLLAGKTGMSAGNTGNLLAAALPMLLGTLRGHVQSNNLTQPQFVSLLSGQRGFLDRVLGGDLLGALGLGGAAAAVGAQASGNNRPAAVPPVATRAATPEPSGGGWMKWLWLALAALAALLLLKFCGQKPADTAAVPASAASAETVVVTPAAPASVAAPAAPASEPAPAPSAAAPAADASATAAAPAAADASASANADAGTVKYENETLSFYFGTGKTTVDKNAADAVSAEIVAKGKEGKTLVVSGYNDPRGDKAKNAELSKNRAKAVKAYLVEQGVAEGKIDLRKPVETDGKSGSLAEDRRVDVKAE